MTDIVKQQTEDVDEGRRIPDLDPTETIFNPEDTIGAPGVAIYGGTLVEQEKDSRLTGTEKYLSYSNLLANNSIVSAGVRFFLNIASGVEWEVQVTPENEGDSKAEEIAEQIKFVMHDMETPWHTVVRDALTHRFYGFSLQEMVAKRYEKGEHAGLTGMKKIAKRAQATICRWDQKKNGDLEGVMQQSPQTQQESYLPRAKMIYCVDDTLHDSPEGLGIFRHIVKLHARLVRYEILEGWGFERDLRGTPIGKAPLGVLAQMVAQKKITAAKAAAIRKPIEDFIEKALKGIDTGIVLDSAVYKGTGENNAPSANAHWGIELLKGETTSQEEMSKAIERIERSIARLLGVEQLMLGSDSRGSHALSQDKSQQFGVVIDSALNEVARCMERDFLRMLFDLNGWDEKYMPRFRLSKAQFREVGEIVNALKDMALAGAPIPINDGVINAVRRLLGMPDQEEQDEELALALEEMPLRQEEAQLKQQDEQNKIAMEAAKNPPQPEPGQPGPAKGKPKATGKPGTAGPAEPKTSSDAPGKPKK